MGPVSSKVIRRAALATLCAAVFIVAAAGVLVLYGVGAKEIIPFQSFKASYMASDAVLLDRSGEAIHYLRVDDSGRRLGWTGLPDISPAFIRSILFVEDRRFFDHSGVDLRAFISASLQGLRTGRLRGASTVSMQVASMIDRSLRPRGRKRSLSQKWNQVLTALALEKKWTKEEILEAYINLISYRGELQGVRAASKGLFGKEPSGLTEEESFILACLVTSPNASGERITKRAWYFARKAGTALSRDDLEKKSLEALSSPYRIVNDTSLAPHVARMVLGEGDGAKVTTLDGNLQRLVLQLLGTTLAQLRQRNVFDAAVLVVENKSGEILAYAGNAGRTSSAPWVDGVRARRQAGSTLKPFLYGLAIEKGYMTAASILEDTPLSVATPTGLYVPGNYDNRFRGKVTVRTALASSLNVPAVKTLLVTEYGPFLKRLREFGFVSLTEEADFYGYSIALGSADVELYELVSAYRTLARSGVKGSMRLTFDERGPPDVRVMDERASYIVSQILSDRESRSATFGLENTLSTRFWTAVKTGTSKDMRDNWCIGFSDRYTVGVWVGNFSGEPMRDVSGIAGAAPVWLEIMNHLHGSVPSGPPSAPTGVIAKEVSFENGFEPTRKEYFLAGTEPAMTVSAEKTYQRPRIVYPQDETLITVDPDIPDDFQRVPFRSEPEGSAFRWVLNDRETGTATPFFLWEPQRGRHVLSIVDHEGAVVDSVTFTVR